ITDPDLRGTIKELSQLDGAFIVTEDGIFVSACRYLDAPGAGVDMPLGLGSRHLAAANMSSATRAVGIVVSESATVRVFCHGKLTAEIIPELWLMNRRNLQLTGQLAQENVGDVAVITQKRGGGQRVRPTP